VKQGHDLTTLSKYAELTSSSPGFFSLRFGGHGHDAILNDQWYQQAIQTPAWPLLQSMLLNYWRTWDELNEIQMRFFDGLAWHSDAISEPDPGARIVKFWTAIERVLSATQGGSIATRVAVCALKQSATLRKS
jgi:hypothetical protein